MGRTVSDELNLAANTRLEADLISLNPSPDQIVTSLGRDETGRCSHFCAVSLCLVPKSCQPIFFVNSSSPNNKYQTPHMANRNME